MDFSKGNEMEEMHKFTITKTLIAGGDIDPIKIYEGTHEDAKDGVSWGNRKHAIKRIPKADREKEIIQTRAYMELDQMPKIVRCHGRRRFLLHLFGESGLQSLGVFMGALTKIKSD
jgi:hypothetical protein